MRSLRAFQSMWVAGTLGAFFTAFARNIPLHIDHAINSTSISWEYTADVLLRFAYAAWFLAYFFLSNLDNEAATPDERAVAFDVVQSIASLGAIYCFGFAVTGRGFSEEQPGPSLAAANVAVGVVCLFSVLFYGTVTPQHNLLRLCGLAVAAIGVLVGVSVSARFVVLGAGWVILFALVGYLVMYGWQRTPPAAITLRELERRVIALEAGRPGTETPGG